MARKLTSAQKGQLLDQLTEVTRVTVNGIRPFEDVRQALQDIIEGKNKALSFDPATSYRPEWYETPERQLAMVRQWNEEYGWGFQETDFPAVPEFTRQAASEVLLLGIYLSGGDRKTGLHCTASALWNVIVAPEGWQKRWGIKSQLLYADERGVHWLPGLRWVAFDHNAYAGMSAERAFSVAEQQGRMLLAGVEVLAAAALFPRWADSWDGRSSRWPHMAVCRTYSNNGWSHVAFGKWSHDHTFGPITESSYFVNRGCASPTIREI